MAHFCSKDQSIILGPSTEIIEKYSKQVRENNALELQPAELGSVEKMEWALEQLKRRCRQPL